MPGGHSDTVPPDSIPNSEVKRISGDGSVGIPHVRVAHCQAPNLNGKALHFGEGLFYLCYEFAGCSSNMECDKFFWKEFERASARPLQGRGHG